MSDQLKMAKQIEILQAWREEVDTCRARLAAAAQNATRAVAKRQEYVAISSPTEIADTAQGMATDLLETESASLDQIATLCQVFAAATGQTNAAMLAKLQSRLP